VRGAGWRGRQGAAVCAGGRRPAGGCGRGGLYRRAEAGKGVAACVDGRWVRPPVVVSDLAAREECEWAGQHKPKPKPK